MTLPLIAIGYAMEALGLIGLGLGTHIVTVKLLLG